MCTCVCVHETRGGGGIRRCSRGNAIVWAFDLGFGDRVWIDYSNFKNKLTAAASWSVEHAEKVPLGSDKLIFNTPELYIEATHVAFFIVPHGVNDLVVF